MQALAWIVRFVVVVVLVWFAVRNGQDVEVLGLPGQSWRTPLIFVMLLAFVAGLLIGLMGWLPTVVRQRREIAKLRKARSAPVAVAGPVTEPPVPAREGDGG